MKRLNILTLIASALLVLSGCEMKNELWGTDKGESGELQLDVDLKLPTAQTRDASGSVSTADYPVTIKGTTTTLTGATVEVVRTFEKASELPSTITLPVGHYTVTAHTPGEIAKQMDAPYYGGNQSMEIKKGIRTESTVTCKMQNSRIQMKYGDDFFNNFTAWNITVDDGSDKALVYTTSTEEPQPTYWYFGTGTTTTSIITVNVRATTVMGNTVTETRQFKKVNATEQYDDVNDYFEGGDALHITMGSVEDLVGNVTGIRINTSIVFENHDEVVDLPTYTREETLTIAEPEGNSYLADGVNVTETVMPTNVTLDVVATAGLKQVWVKGESTNVAASAYLSALGLSAGDGADLLAASSSSLGNLFPLPTAGGKSYTFKLTQALLEGLRNFVGTHKLTLKVMDGEGNTALRTLLVKVTKEGDAGDTEAPSLLFQTNVDKINYMSGNEISYSMSDVPAEFNAYIKAPKGIDKIIVQMKGGNAAFDAILSDLKMDGQQFADGTGVNIVDNADFQALLDGQSLTGVSRGAVAYDFPIGVFFTFLNVTGETDAGKAHEFAIEIIDQEGNKINDTLKIHITK